MRSPYSLVVQGNVLRIQQGGTFTDPGATATDVEDGTIPSASITTTGTVNTAVQGTYTLTYSVTDSGGLTTKQARTVAVLPPGNLPSYRSCTPRRQIRAKPLIMHGEVLRSGPIPSSPTEAEVTDYYPYGSQRIHAGPFTEQKKFTGYEYDTDAGISYANVRYYIQDVGRRTS
jgi:Domain of unknown function (DUF5011)